MPANPTVATVAVTVDRAPALEVAVEGVYLGTETVLIHADDDRGFASLTQLECQRIGDHGSLVDAERHIELAKPKRPEPIFHTQRDTGRVDLQRRVVFLVQRRYFGAEPLVDRRLEAQGGSGQHHVALVATGIRTGLVGLHLDETGSPNGGSTVIMVAGHRRLADGGERNRGRQRGGVCESVHVVSLHSEPFPEAQSATGHPDAAHGRLKALFQKRLL